MNHSLTPISGILRLELAKDRYERCGLVGQPIQDAGRKHMKTRFGEYNRSTVRLPITYVAVSGRSGSEVTVNVTWEERLRENRLGVQECPQSLTDLALL